MVRPDHSQTNRQTTMHIESVVGWPRTRTYRLLFGLVLVPLLIFAHTGAQGAMLLKDYLVRYDRGWDILCEPYQVKKNDWVLKILRTKGEIAHEDFRDFLGIFARLNPHVKDIDLLRPGQVVDIPLKKLSQGNFAEQSSGVVTIPFVMIDNPRKLLEKHSRTYTIQRGDTVSQLIAKKFGGRYGNLTYNQGLKLLKALNPHIKDVNQIYAGEKLYLPDPSVRQQQWYTDLFDEKGNLVDIDKAASPSPGDASGARIASRAPREAAPATPAAEAAAAMGVRLMDKGTYYLPMKKSPDFELDLSRYPMLDMPSGAKAILTTKDKVMDVALPLLESYWNDVKAVKIPENASAEQIMEAVLSALENGEEPPRLAFSDGAVSINVTSKWIQNAPPRYTCITPIKRMSQLTHAAVVRYLDQNDIVIRELLNGSVQPPPEERSEAMRPVVHLDAHNQRALVESFAGSMSFHYSPDTMVSFPYAGIQVKAQSNLLRIDQGREVLIDFGDLYGDAIKAIKKNTGMDILEIDTDKRPLDILHDILQYMNFHHTRSPVFHGAQRAPVYNTAIVVDGLLIIMPDGEERLYTDKQIPELIARFINERQIGIFKFDTAPR